MPYKLVVGIDETGSFKEQKLTGERHRNSGMVAVVSSWSAMKVTSHLEALARENGLKYPEHFHCMELLNPHRLERMGLEMNPQEALELVERLLEGMKPAIEATVAVRGKTPGRVFFHEQQAYGEMLLALLHQVREAHGDLLKRVEAVEIRVATRSHVELTGFTEPDDYNRKLIEYLRDHVTSNGWPAGTSVTVSRGDRDPHLILADFQASRLGRGKLDAWNLSQLHLPSSWQTTLSQLQRLDPVTEILLKLQAGEPVKARWLNQADDQTAHAAMRRLTTAAHGIVRDRHDKGSLPLALKLVEFLWPRSQHAGAVAVQGELCTIAAEVLSHQGKPANDSEVAAWRERAEDLPQLAWATNAVSARMARLDHRCQTVQTDSFNVFDFNTVLFEFLGHEEEYEKAAGGADAVETGDELYGKILGTLGQTCGFLRPQDEAIGRDAWEFLQRSKLHFERSNPMFRDMSFGYRLTDLWDRGELDAAEQLMQEESLPKAGRANPYQLLHRLRLASSQKHHGQAHEAIEPLTGRLLDLVADGGSVDGQTPFDLCLKWALYLAPDNDLLSRAAKRWAGSLDTRQVALLGTSLPLLMLLRQVQNAQSNTELLMKWPGFREHWKTARCNALRQCIEEGKSPGYEALRGMPWNYA